MGLFDNLGGALKDAFGRAETAALPALVSAVLAKTDLGSLQGIVNKLQEAGLGSQVQSWLGNGTNLPVSADQLRSALGNDQVRQIAQQLGLPVDGALKVLAEHLPTAVDQASPNGEVEEPAETAETADEEQAAAPAEDQEQTATPAEDQARPGSLADQAGLNDIKR
jgi:uncharacterized protein YidB (DUF937 family)